jgi:hypothetical protein
MPKINDILHNFLSSKMSRICSKTGHGSEKRGISEDGPQVFMNMVLSTDSLLQEKIYSSHNKDGQYVFFNKPQSILDDRSRKLC